MCFLWILQDEREKGHKKEREDKEIKWRGRRYNSQGHIMVNKKAS